MTFYVAVLLLCSSPSFTSCETQANRNSFQSIESCLADVNEVSDYYRGRGYSAVGSCFEVKIGESV